MVSKAVFLVKSAKQSGIDITVNGSELQLKLTKANGIDPQLLQEIKNNKESIIDLLSNKWKSTRLNQSEKLLKNHSRDSNKPVRLSFSQERLWFIHQLEGTDHYHLPMALRLSGRLNHNAIAGSLRNLVERHEILRSVIIENNGESYQQVRDSQNWEMARIDGSAYRNDPEGLQYFLRRLISKPFDLAKDYMLRATLICLKDSEHILVVTLHHIASDGWSLPIIINEVAESYTAYVEGRTSRLAPLEIQYADFAIWQRDYLQGGTLDKKIEYWKEKLNDVAPLKLPVDFARPYTKTNRGATVDFTIDKETTGQLQMFCHKQGCTLFMALLTVYKVLLHRYSGQQDICVGTPVAGRYHEEVDGLIGFFVNTLALRTEVSSEDSFIDLLNKVRNTTLEAYDHQEAPFEKVVEAVVKDRNSERSLIFQVMFVLQNTPHIPELKLPELILSEEKLKNDISKFDISFYLTETEGGLQGYIDYSTDLYKEETIVRLINHYKTLLNAAIEQPSEKIGLLPMLTQAEERQLLEAFEDTKTIYPAQKSIIELFEQQVNSMPDSVAVVFEEKQITYQQLNEQSNQFAHYLRSKGVGEETLVPICTERSIEMMVGILGILKAGGAYVPIDPDYPSERIKFMLEDTAAGIVVTSVASAYRLPKIDGINIIEIDDALLLISLQPSANLNVAITPASLAYVIYTSGSTGRPKGVLVEHGNVVSLVCGTDYVTLTNQDTLLSTGSSSFDATTFEYYSMLLHGGQLVLCTENKLLDHQSLKEEINNRAVTLMWFTSSWFNQLIETDITLFENLQTILAGGEKLSAYHVEKLRQTYPHIAIINGYGPTENTTFSLTYRVIESSINRPLPIGKPLSNRSVLLLDAYGQLVPIGVAGEICVGGAGLSRGYLNNEALTKEKFIANPYSNKAGATARLYKTGDIGRQLPDGNIEYLGRGDEQVKIRGYRIELGEIEAVLQQHEAVKQAVVVARENREGNKQLVAYIVATEKPFSNAAIYSYLSGNLPEYMIPAVWVEIDKLPLTPNGKADRKALPDPEAGELIRNEYVAPQNETEQQIAEIWKHLLGIDKVGVNDHFFEIGGHSLLATRALAAIRKQLQIELNINYIFNYPTVRLLSEQIKNKSIVNKLPAIIRVQLRPELVPLSFGQERLWFIDKLQGSIQYCLTSILRLNGNLDKNALTATLQYIINRHETLRSVIQEEQGKIYQQVKDAAGWEMLMIDGSSYSEENLQQYIHQSINTPFDLSNDYMLRATLITLKEEAHVVVVTLHHIASDGWSLPILVKEVATLYEVYQQGRIAELPPLPVQYADYAIWQRNYLQGEILDQKLSYWKEKLQGVPTLQLPTDYPRPAVQSTRGANTKFIISKALTNELNALSRQQGTTLFMTLLAAFKVMLQRYSGQDDICVGTPIAGRQQQELEGLIGFFVNTLALRTVIDTEDSFISLLADVKATTIEAYANQEVPFDKVVEVTGSERDSSRNPLVQVLLSMQNTKQIPELRLGDTTLSVQEYENNTSQLDIICNLTETDMGLEGNVIYCTDLYAPQTIQRMMKHFVRLLGAIVQSPGQLIRSFSLLSPEEENQLLVTFNNTKATQPQHNTIISLFEEQVAKVSQNTAVVFREEQLTFQELNEKSNQLARYLKTYGVKQEQLVPICMERSLEMLVTILGILKAGAAYVPIDPAYPEERIAYLLEDCKATIIISDSNSEAKLPNDPALRIISMDTDRELISSQLSENVQTAITPQQLAYVIYTSGSTGKPKGVMVEHAAILNYLLNSKTNYIADESNGSGSFVHLSYTFDASLTAMLMPLLFGKAVIIGSGPATEVFDDSNLQKYAPYDFIKITPSHLPLLQPKMKTGITGLLTKKLVIGGEALFMSQVESFGEDLPDIEIINEYGPTEATVGCSTFSLHTLHNNQPQANSMSIGKPIDNVELYILGKNNELLPIGLPGELCIGGAGLARGYLNQPALTEEKFIQHPFNSDKELRVYKTGDIASWTADGNITYLGRRDEQVKIRGYRIELGEIESALQEYRSVKQAVVVVKESKEGNKRLVGYVVPVDDFVTDELVCYLKNRLPDYMIPAQWVSVEQMPLTVNGKIDRKALPDPELPTDTTGRGYVAPRNEMEKVLAGIWQELLDVETVGIHDNFFQLGGDSIIIIQIVSRARRAGYEFQVADVFAHQTIAGLSALKNQNAENLSTDIGEQDTLSGESGLLPIQQWFFENAGNDVSHYNQSILLNIDKAVGESDLQIVLEKLTAHHDALRFVYSKNGENWKQEYGTDKGLFVVENLTVTNNALSNLITEKANFYQRNFEIKKGKLVCVVLMQTPPSENANRLLFVIHHLAIDGVSWRILLGDLTFLLNELKNKGKAALSKKSSSYRQWYNALESYGQTERGISQKTYWDYVIKNYQPLPVDREHSGLLQIKDTSDVAMRLSAEQTRRLTHQVPPVYHTEINDILMAALAKTLAEFADTDRVTIGMEGHGREGIDESIDTTHTVGWFTTHYPVLLEVNKAKGEDDLIKTVKEQLRKVPDKGIGFGVLKYFNKEKANQDKSHWDIVFNYLGQADNVLQSAQWLSPATESAGDERSPDFIINEKLAINGIIKGGELVLNWTYSNKHYKEETVTALVQQFQNTLESLINHCIHQQETVGPVFTPSDYGLGAEITHSELDAFLNESFNGKVRRDSLESLYRLSGLQEGMLFHGLYDVGIGAYIEQLSCNLSGVDVEKLHSSWLHLIKRHSILRSAFYFDEFKVPVQCVYKEVELPLVVLDYRTMSTAEQLAAINKFDEEDRNKGFNFKEAPLMRLALFQLSEDSYRLLWTSHHILFDGWSFAILMEEFLSTYDLLISGEKTLANQKDYYEDYIRFIERSNKEAEKQYWRNYLSGVEQSTLLPFIAHNSERNKGQGIYQQLHLHLDAAISKKLQAFAQRHRLTLNTLMQGVWAYLLHQYTGMADVVYGIVVSGRPDNLLNVEQRVGMYINTLLFRSSLKEEQEIVGWLQTIQGEQIRSRQYQHTPLHVAQAWSGVQGDLFDTLLTFENYPVSKAILSKEWALKVSDFQMQEHTNYPLSILINSTDKIDMLFSYNALLLDKVYVKEISSHFENILLQLQEKDNQKVSDLNLLTIAEQQTLLHTFNTPPVLQKDKTIISLFEEQVVKTPNALAVVFNDKQITYQELNERANNLAHHLKNKGVKRETLVPIYTDRSIDMMIGIWGILKAGAAYVPIDTDFPHERVAYILADTGAANVVSSTSYKSKLPGSAEVEIVEIDSNIVFTGNTTDDVSEPVNGNQLAYVIYTSGSTGKPKGVMVEHSSLLNYLLNNKAKYIDTESSNTGSYIHLSYTFDASLTAMFMPLLSGKSLVIGAKQSIDAFEDSNLLKYAPYDFIKITPAHLELLQPKFQAFGEQLLAKKLVIGGEALYPGQFNLFIEHGVNVEIINEYGPTEATVGCTVYSFKTVADKNAIKSGISIGKPIDNAVIFIVNSNHHLVPVGVKGEICISGAGVARGYLNQLELTAAKFITVPLGDKEERIYKTGDIGRWLPDGNIEYLGRMDDQVKIRGYRVELGEIENQLQQSELISQAVVIAKEDNETGKRLKSYYVPDMAILKSKEKALSYQRVANWKELYETEYGQTEGAKNIDPEFNIIGWNDSFTGQAIPANEMREWLADIVNVVLEEKPQHVLEIGCGTGLIYYQLAGKVKKYIGSDLSKSSIKQIKERISQGERDYGETELFTAPAHEITLPEGEEVDTILLNSIVQYFPGEDYMNLVMEKCLSLINGSGRIIIGDVRDNRLLKLFKSRLKIQKLQNSIPLKEFEWAVEQDLINEEELCFSPDYFYKLKVRYPQITQVDIQWKKGDYINELSLYRYTVVLYVGVEKNIITPKWLSWNDIADKKKLFADNDQQHNIAITDVPNHRLWKEKLLHEEFQNPAMRTVGDMAQALEREDKETAQVKQLLNAAESNGFNYRLIVHEDPLKVNLLFYNYLSQSFVLQPSFAKAQHHTDATNIPLFTDINFSLQKEIREQLLNSLPDYMVPAEFNALRQLPLTVNGKVDRLFLSRREDKVYINVLNYLPPTTDTEITLAGIWKELLHIKRVGIEDNFFDLGGHSLLAMRVISAIRKQLEVELSIKELFVHPTISSLATHLQKLSKGLLLPSIEVTDLRPNKIPLSFSQERLWFIDQLDGSLQYHIPAVLRLKGNLDVEALSNALQQIVNRHEVLRTVIREERGQAYQHIQEKDAWALTMIDSSEFTDTSKLQLYIKELINVPFNLAKDYMLRAALVTLDKDEYILVVTLHHIASDGWSTSVMVKELVELYNAAVENRTASLTPLPVQYADYAIWQRTNLQGEVWEKKLTYWKEKMDGVAALQLPTDYARPPVQSTNGAVKVFTIDKELNDQLKVVSQQQGVTLFMTLLAAFNVLLHRYTGQQDICVGTPIAGRQQQELENLIGFFVNTLALRTEVNGNTTFKDLLQQVKNTTLEAYMYQEVPFEKVVELVVKERDMSRSPLFQVVLALQNTPDTEELRSGELQFSPGGNELSGHDTSIFDLSFAITETVQGLLLNVEYCTDLFNEQTINKMVAHFNILLKSIVQDPQQTIGTLPMLTAVETHHLLVELNDTKKVFSTDKTVVDLFQEQVLKNPQAIAVVFGVEQLTYHELNERTKRLAHYLRSKGVQEEVLVPVCMKRSTELVIALLGILKAGGAYVPIDPEYPAERINFMIEDTRASLVLTTNEIANQLTVVANTEIVDVSEHTFTINQQPANDLKTQADPQHLAYVIYTSGSTGRPKGVMIEHKSLANLVNWHQQEYTVTPASKATVMAGVGFDAFGWEIWPYLSFGASLYIIDDDTRISLSRLTQQYVANGISHSFIATALVPDFVQETRNKNLHLQYLLTGGDKLSAVNTNGLPYKLINNYGPTENTVVASYYEIPAEASSATPPIGKPISNTTIYLLNEQAQLVPEGVPGELCIGGNSLAKGYLNRPDLTTEKFIKHPFDQTPGARLYKSGDLCRWLPDGNIEYLGRIDEQIKIRGYRIELGEIEQVLQESDFVHQSVVLAKEDKNGNKILAGYIVPKGVFNKEQIITHLKSKLPEYMVPAVWVTLEQLPLTNNGKIDKKALPHPDINAQIKNEYVAPRTGLEEKLVAIWKELLHVKQVGVYDNFFELGGHSLLVMKMIAHIEDSLAVSIPVKALFRFTCISDLSKYLETQTSKAPADESKSYKVYDI